MSKTYCALKSCRNSSETKGITLHRVKLRQEQRPALKSTNGLGYYSICSNHLSAVGTGIDVSSAFASSPIVKSKSFIHTSAKKEEDAQLSLPSSPTQAGSSKTRNAKKPARRSSIPLRYIENDKGEEDLNRTYEVEGKMSENEEALERALKMGYVKKPSPVKALKKFTRSALAKQSVVESAPSKEKSVPKQSVLQNGHSRERTLSKPSAAETGPSRERTLSNKSSVAENSQSKAKQENGLAKEKPQPKQPVVENSKEKTLPKQSVLETSKEKLPAPKRGLIHLIQKKSAGEIHLKGGVSTDTKENIPSKAAEPTAKATELEPVILFEEESQRMEDQGADVLSTSQLSQDSQATDGYVSSPEKAGTSTENSIRKEIHTLSRTMRCFASGSKQTNRRLDRVEQLLTSLCQQLGRVEEAVMEKLDQIQQPPARFF